MGSFEKRAWNSHFNGGLGKRAWNSHFNGGLGVIVSFDFSQVECGIGFEFQCLFSFESRAWNSCVIVNWSV